MTLWCRGRPPARTTAAGFAALMFLLAASCSTDAPVSRPESLLNTEPHPSPDVAEVAATSSPPNVIEASGKLGTLRVSVFPASDTGTMRFADRIVVAAGARRPFTRETSMEKNVVAPLLQRIVPLAEDSFLLLGWSATTGADTDYHALVIHIRPDDVMLADELVLEAAGWTGALLPRRHDRGTSVGVLIPACAHAGPESCVLDARAGSQISSHRFTVDLSSGRHRLLMQPASVTAQEQVYCARSWDCGRDLPVIDGEPMRVAWFDIVDDAFVPARLDDQRP